MFCSGCQFNEVAWSFVVLQSVCSTLEGKWVDPGGTSVRLHFYPNGGIILGEWTPPIRQGFEGKIVDPSNCGGYMFFADVDQKYTFVYDSTTCTIRWSNNSKWTRSDCRKLTFANF